MFQKITENWLGVFLLLAVFALASAIKVSAVCPLTGSNLIVNGDAEADQSAVANGSDDVDVSAWNPETGQFTIVRYTTGGGFPTTTDPGPADRGNFLFAGGNAESSSGTQTIDVSGCAAQIDAGNQSFSLSGFLGGFQNQDDNAQLTVTFRNAANTSLGTATIGPVLSADRGANTGLLARNTNGAIPIGTRTVEVVLLMTRSVVSGSYNDGYADNLSFMLTASTAATVAISGRVVTAQGLGISNARVFVTNSSGETQTAITNKLGFYHFAEISAGETCILSVSHKRYQFVEPTQVHFVTEERDDINFTALPSFSKRVRL